jgi:NADPH-dependent 2,4-dienoyl-CoA reductase/sulfur reductase-like enzyme
MMAKRKIVIVGASVAGLSTAEQLRQEGFQGEITLLGLEPHLPYNRPPLSKQVLLEDWDLDRTTLRTREEIQLLDVTFLASTPATGLDVKKRIVTTATGEFGFDVLVIATGSSARKLPLNKDVPTLRTIDDALAIRSRLKAAKRVAIFGAGVLGSELASAARKFGAEVSIVGRGHKISFGAVRDKLSKPLETLHESHGIELLLGREVKEVTNVANGFRIEFSEGGAKGVDFAIAAIGSAPTVDWLKSSGLDLSNGIVCDSNGEAAPGIYAVGDVAGWKEFRTGLVLRSDHQMSAIDQSMAVARRIVTDSPAEPHHPLFWSEIHGVRIKGYGRFTNQPLEEVSGESDNSRLYVSKSGDEITGIVSWNLAPKAFREAQAMVVAGTWS